MRPVNDNVIVRLEEKAQTVGSIIIPDKVQDKPDTAIVLFGNQGLLLDNGTRSAPIVKTGDKILFNRFAGVEITLPDGKALIIKDSDVFAILD
jgi:chaperonin GroES